MRNGAEAAKAVGRWVVWAALGCFAAPAVAQPVAPAQPAAEQEPKPPVAVTRVYDVRDLLLERRDYPLESDVLPVTQVFGYSPQRGRQRNNNGLGNGRRTTNTQNEMEEALTKLIEETVDPESWRDQGGTLGAVRIFNAQLIVSQSAENHAALQKLIDQMRQQAMRMVTVRANWVLLSPEDVQAVAKPYKPDRPMPRPSAERPDGPAPKPGDKPAPPAAPVAPAAPPAAAADAGDGTDPALLVADLAAVDKLADKGTRYRAQTTSFNGQLVHVASGRARTVIADQTPVVGNGVMGYDPSVSLVQDGASLEVAALLTPDGGSAVVEITSVVSEWAGDGDRPEKTRPLAVVTTQPAPGDAPATVDRINAVVHQMRTTVALPVGQPILVGGMTLSAGKAGGKPAGDNRQMYLIVEVLAAKPSR